MTKNSLIPGSVLIDGVVVIGVAVAVTLVVVALDLDMRLARAVFDPQRTEDVRGYTNSLSSYSFAVAAVGLAWLAVPRLRRWSPLASRCAGVFVMTLIVAVLGLIMNLKVERHRPRPSEVVEFGGEYRYKLPFGAERCRCKSFPSSAAGFGFLLATPFFVLRRQRRWLAYGFLGAGLLWGSYIGYGRMVANMHWVTDIVWSAAFVLATASVVARVNATWRADD